jgi:Uma2 family endonuclease
MVIEKKKTSYDDYQAFISRPENADHIFELIDGEIVEKMPSFKPSRIGSRISHLLSNYLDEHDIGYVTGEAGGYKMSSEDTFNPDVGYISRVRLPEEPEREAPVPPDFAVEVKSPTDRKREMRRKAEKYLEYGTRLVWLVFPDEQQVEVYSVADEDVVTVGMDGVLDGKDVLPDFSLAVKDIFK